jgi:YHS domain-containing protein
MEISYDDGRITFGDRRETGLLARDPVCGMDVEIARAGASTDYEGRTYYFCSLQCKEDFERQPAMYVGADHQK